MRPYPIDPYGPFGPELPKGYTKYYLLLIIGLGVLAYYLGA